MPSTENARENKKNSLRDSILADIHARKIQPRPRWQYVALHTGLWLAGIITIILGSFAVGLLIFEMTLPERAYTRWMEMSDNHWIVALPYFWGIGVIVALTIGHFIFRNTGRSYRVRAGLIFLLLFAGSLFGGEILYVTRMSHWGDKKLQGIVPRYGRVRADFARVMPRPEDGMLPIRVSALENDIIVGVAPDGKIWNVRLNCVNDFCRTKKQNISLKKPLIFEGKVTGTDEFTAFDIFFKPKDKPMHIPNLREKGNPQNHIQLNNGLIKKGE